LGSVTLLDRVLDVARDCPFDQLLCVLGGSSDDVLAAVDFDGVEVIENQQFGTGCSSSIAAALRAVDPHCELLVLMLGDQPGVSRDTIESLIDGCGAAALAACAYSDGRGHPLAFARSMFGELSSMHGDKAVWKLLDRHSSEVVDVPIAHSIPLDIDTWEDYEAVLAKEAT
jgi:molybdenum cofactor cytidylyltransferase